MTRTDIEATHPSADREWDIRVGALQSGVRPVLGVSGRTVFARVLHAKQSPTMGSEEVIVDVKDTTGVAELLNKVNATGGFYYWEFRTATADETATLYATA